MLASLQVLSQTQGDRLKSDVPSPIGDEARRHNQLGIGFARQKNDCEAIQEFREAIRLQPDYGEAHCNLGLASHRSLQV
jgi:Flp pilus assembly protein TadD